MEDFYIRKRNSCEQDLIRNLGECAKGTSRKMQFHTTDTFGLEVDFEFATSGDIGMTTRITRCCSASCELAHSTHNGTLDILLKAMYHTFASLARHYLL